jgi:hypothetical protein
VIEQKNNKLRDRSHKETCSFKPEIGEFNRQLAEIGESQQEFLQRLTISKEVSEQQINEMRQQQKFYQEEYDPKDGQQMFQPKISQYENMVNNDRKMQGYNDVFEALHEEARILKDKKQNLKKVSKAQKLQISEQYRESKKCKQSDTLLYQAQRNKLSKVFEQLDSDYDGYISAHKINLADLSNELLDVMTPLLLKIEEHSLNVDFEQFVEIVMEYSKHLPLCDKALLLGADRPLYRVAPEEPSFAPTLSSNTNAIMEIIGKDRKVKLWEDHRDRGCNKEN